MDEREKQPKQEPSTDAVDSTINAAGPGGRPSDGVIRALEQECGSSLSRVDLKGADKSTQPDSSEPAGKPARLQLFDEIARGGMREIIRGRDADLGRDLVDG